MRDRLTLWGYVLGWRVVRALPRGLAERLAMRVADWAYRRRGKGVRRLASNLARVVPAERVEETTRAGVRSYARYWLEAFRLPVLAADEIVARLRCENEHLLRDGYASGEGAIAVLPHMGNWDVAGAWAVATGMKFTTVAERLKPEGLFDRFVAFRESLGMEVVPLTGGAAPPYDVLSERLRAGALICLLGDRDLTARGVPVTFFGATAKFPAGPAALALRTGARLLPATLWVEGDTWVVRMHDPIPHTDVATMTQAVAGVFEDGIRAHPADWHMLQRLWVDDLDPR